MMPSGKRGGNSVAASGGTLRFPFGFTAGELIFLFVCNLLVLAYIAKSPSDLRDWAGSPGAKPAFPAEAALPPPTATAYETEAAYYNELAQAHGYHAVPPAKKDLP